MPLVLALHGWTNGGAMYEAESGLSVLADMHGFAVVYPVGMDDNTSPTFAPDRTWCSWNVAGSSRTEKRTCTKEAAAKGGRLCYTSCDCNHTSNCGWTSCVNDVTPTGVGTESVTGFLPTLLDQLTAELCIDEGRLYATGLSNGGMATYQLGVSLADRLAAIAPVAGSFHEGVPMPLLDVHGFEDEIVPANRSVSNDGYFYTTTGQIFEAWRKANGCEDGEGPARVQHWPTEQDGVAQLYCVSEGSGCLAPVVRCSWSGPHSSFNGGGLDNAELVWGFLSRFVRRRPPADGTREAPVEEPWNTPTAASRCNQWGAASIHGTTGLGVSLTAGVAAALAAAMALSAWSRMRSAAPTSGWAAGSSTPASSRESERRPLCSIV